MHKVNKELRKEIERALRSTEEWQNHASWYNSKGTTYFK